MNKQKLTLISILLIPFLPLVAFGQWTFKTVDNGFDEPYKIAYTAKNNNAILKLEPVEAEVALPKKYPQQAGMYYFETTYEHSIIGGEFIDLSSGALRNRGLVFSDEKLVIVGETSLETNGTTKKYYLLFDRYKKVFCEQEEIKFTIPTSIQSFDLQNQKEIDSLIEVAKIYSEQCATVPQLYENQFQISFYLTGGYHCDDEIPVDISFLVGSQFLKFSVIGVKSEDSGTVFFLDDINSSEMKDAFLKSSMVKLRFNESHCENDYYEFKMSGSTAAINFVSKP
jgi:hypothetical protein